MLIRNIKPLIPCELFHEIIEYHMNLDIEIAKQTTQTIESLLASFIEILQDQNMNRCYGKDLMKLLDFSKEIDFISALHFIIVNPDLLSFRSDVLNTFSKTIQRFDESQIQSLAPFFENEETSNFYPYLLFTTTDFSELKPLSIINSILFDKFENIRTILIENNLKDFLLAADPEQISELFVSFSKFITSDMEFLFQNDYLQSFIETLLGQISSQKIESSSNAIQSLLNLINKGIQFEIPNIESIAIQLFYILHSEDEKCIKLSLNFFIALNLPLPGDFSIIYTFIESTNIMIAVESIKLIQHFPEIFTQDEKAKYVLLKVLDDGPFRVSFQSALTLILFDLDVDEKSLFFQKLIIFLESEDGQEIFIQEVMKLLSEATTEEHVVLDQILIDNIQTLERVACSDNEPISELADQIIKVIMPE